MYIIRYLSIYHTFCVLDNLKHVKLKVVSNLSSKYDWVQVPAKNITNLYLECKAEDSRTGQQRHDIPIFWVKVFH